MDTHGAPRRHHVLQAVHGLPRRLHGGRRDDLQGAAARRATTAGSICMHAENGGVIDTLVKEALRKGRDGAEVPRADAARRAPRAKPPAARSRWPRWRACPIYIVHLSCADALEKVRQARDMGLPAYAETCPQYLFLSYDDYEREGFEGAKFVMSPPLREKWHQDVLWKGLAQERPAGGLDRPLPVLHERAAAEAARPGRLLEDPERRAGHRDPPDAAVGRRRSRRAASTSHRFVELVSTNPARMFGLWPRKGHDRGRVGRRPGGLGSRQGGDALRETASHARRLQPVRGPRRARARPRWCSRAAR